MAPIPLWKLKRELHRLRRQFIGVPVYVTQYLFATPYYDLVMKPRRRVTPGALSPAARVAIYLIFPSGGLLPSHLRALDYIAASGYTPLIVSNLPLSEAERTQLAARSWQVIERKNFGYDFGGYREAVLWIGERLGGLERLALLNDSTWFPLPGAIDWLREAEALGVDYAGVAWTGAVAHPDPDDYMDVLWKVDKRRRNFHYASYALSLSPAILSRPDFRRFWRRFRLTQHKNRTVRRGEIGLTKWVMQRGLTHGATTELADLPEILAALPEADLHAVLRSQISLTDPEMQILRSAFIAALGTEGGGDRDAVERMILTGAARQGASYALADYLVRHRRFPFLKKSPAGIAGEPGRIMLALGRSLSGAAGAEISAEIEAMAARAARSAQASDDDTEGAADV